MDMTPEEVKQYWRGYCERHKVKQDLIAKGEARIEADPEYWADHTMGELLDVVSN